MSYYDCLVIGAGFAGAVVAGELARRGQKKVLVLERRNHIGGNAYDRLDHAGVLVHQYGPHIFHTNDQRVFDYLSQYTAWNGYQHRVVTNIPAQTGKDTERLEFPVPFNLTSLEVVFGKEQASQWEKMLIQRYGAEKKVPILELRQDPAPEIAALSDYIYEHVFVHYTMKQWGQRPEEIDPATTARVPIFLSRDDRYFQDRYQGLPLDGYTPLFQKLLRHPNLTVELNTNAMSRLSLRETTCLDGEPFDGPVIFTGATDELFQWKYGPLPYRTLNFQFETFPKEFYQSHGTVNYTVDQDYTRITEFKHMTLQSCPGVTTIVKESAKDYTGLPDEIPYYAIINAKNNALYAKYRAESERFSNLYLLGRLAEYKYYNMDAMVGRALQLADRLLGG